MSPKSLYETRPNLRPTESSKKSTYLLKTNMLEIWLWNFKIVLLICFKIGLTIRSRSLQRGAWKTAVEKICSRRRRFCSLKAGIEVSWSARKNFRLICSTASKSFLLTRSGSRLKKRSGAHRSHWLNKRFQRFEERWNGALNICQKDESILQLSSLSKTYFI